MFPKIHVTTTKSTIFRSAIWLQCFLCAQMYCFSSLQNCVSGSITQLLGCKPKWERSRGIFGLFVGFSFLGVFDILVDISCSAKNILFKPLNGKQTWPTSCRPTITTYVDENEKKRFYIIFEIWNIWTKFWGENTIRDGGTPVTMFTLFNCFKCSTLLLPLFLLNCFNNGSYVYLWILLYGRTPGNMAVWLPGLKMGIFGLNLR